MDDCVDDENQEREEQLRIDQVEQGKCVKTRQAADIEMSDLLLFFDNNGNTNQTS